MARVLIPIPQRDFDPTEVAVSWEVLTRLGHEVVFATPVGETAAGDELMLTGRGPRSVGVGAGTAKSGARRACPRRQRRRTHGVCSGCARARSSAPGPVGVGRAGGRGRTDPAGRPPCAGDARLPRERATAVARGGGVPPRDARRRDLPRGAARGPQHRPEDLEVGPLRPPHHGLDVGAGANGMAGRPDQPLLGSPLLPDLRRAPRPARGYMSVQAEVTRALAAPEDFLDVDPSETDARRKRGGRSRDTLDDARPAFVVQDGNYTSARWPGDAHTFARRFAESLGS